MHRRRRLPQKKSNKKPRYRWDSRWTGKKSRFPTSLTPTRLPLQRGGFLLFGVSDKGYYTVPFPVCQPFYKIFLKFFFRLCDHRVKTSSFSITLSQQGLFPATPSRLTSCHYTSLFRLCQLSCQTILSAFRNRGCWLFGPATRGIIAPHTRRVKGSEQLFRIYFSRSAIARSSSQFLPSFPGRFVSMRPFPQAAPPAPPTP